MESDPISIIVTLIATAIIVVAAIFIMKITWKKGKILKSITPDQCPHCNRLMEYNRFMSSWSCRECKVGVHLFLDANKNPVKVELKTPKNNKVSYLIFILIPVVVVPVVVFGFEKMASIVLGVLMLITGILLGLGLVKTYSAYLDEFLGRVKLKHSIRKMGWFSCFAYILVAVTMFTYGFDAPFEIYILMFSFCMVATAYLLYVFENNIECVKHE